jgi:hypothetical protein
MRRGFLKHFSNAMFIGLVYGFSSIAIQRILVSKGIHFYMTVDVGIDLLSLLAGNVVVIYGFFSAFLIFILTKVSEYPDSFRQMVVEKMKIYLWITGFVVAFLFFFLFSILGLELQRFNGLFGLLSPSLPRLVTSSGVVFFDLPGAAPAFCLFFMLIIALLGYLVYSLVVGALSLSDDQLKS